MTMILDVNSFDKNMNILKRLKNVNKNSTTLLFQLDQLNYACIENNLGKKGNLN